MDFNEYGNLVQKNIPGLDRLKKPAEPIAKFICCSKENLLKFYGN
jgi:hypothetical protein